MGPAKTSKRAKPTVDGRHARRQQTEARLLKAVGTLLKRRGVAGLGVNAVAELSGVEKTLIYRYFDGVEGLMAAWASGSEFWPPLEEILGPDEQVLKEPDLPRAAATMLLNYSAALRRRPVTVDLLAWECSHRNALTVAVETIREQRNTELFTRLAQAGFPVDGRAAALSALLAGAVNYFVIRGRELERFGALGLQGEEAWAAMGHLFEAAFRGALT